MRFLCFLVGSGSLIGMMLLIRSILRSRIPPGILYALWLVPAVRLLLPLTMIPVPVLPETAKEASAFGEDAEEAVVAHRAAAGTAQGAAPVDGEISGITEAVFLAESGEDRQDEENAEETQNRQRAAMLSCLPYIWLSGSILCGGYVILINLRLKRSVKQMQRLPEKRLVPVYIRNEAVSPCLFGVFHPCILLSEQTIENRELCALALLHEETHYRQKDHIWTAFRIFLCILYWWNPLVWLGAARAREDAEFACDARALRSASLSEKKAYGYALLEIVEGVRKYGRLVHGITTISGNGKNLKRRLETIVSEPERTRVWPFSVCLLLFLFLCGLCFPVQKARAEEEIAQKRDTDFHAQSGSGTEKSAEEDSEPVKEEKSEGNSEGNDRETADPIKASETENVREPREGYTEPELHYTAAAGWLTDLTGKQEEQEKAEHLARRALKELYDLTGYQVEACFYGYNEIGMLTFARSEEDMKHSRVFYSYYMGEKDGYDNIPSIDIVSARRVWYSDVQQLALPENAETMGSEELAVWFLEHSPLCPEGMVTDTEPVFETDPDWLRLTMEDGTFYEIEVDRKILAVRSIYGPYPEDAQH